MSKKYTAIFSRGLSKVSGKPNAKPVAELIQIIEGDKDDIFSVQNLKEQKKIFYWRTMYLTDTEKDNINEALTSPHYIPNTGIITYPRKNVTLNSFSASDIAKLKARGNLPEKLGGDIVGFSNLDITEA